MNPGDIVAIIPPSTAKLLKLTAAYAVIKAEGQEPVTVPLSWVAEHIEIGPVDEEEKPRGFRMFNIPWGRK